MTDIKAAPAPSFSPEVANPHVTLPDPTPAQSDSDWAAYVRSLFTAARAHKRQYLPRWNRNFNLMQNRTWAAGRADYLPAPEIPEIRPIVSSLCGWMTDQRPTFDAVASASPHTPYANFIQSIAQDLTTTMQAVSDVLQYEAAIKMAIWDSFTFGTGLLKSSWDMSLDGGMGNAVLERVDPYTFYPDPLATNERDGNYYIEVRTMSVQELDRRYRAGHLFKGGMTEEVDTHPTSVSGPGQQPRHQYMSRPDTGLGSVAYVPSTKRLPTADSDQVTVLECWLREHIITKLPNSNEDTVFDYWRVIVVAGNHVLLNVPAYKLWSHGQHPYSRFVEDDEGEFWGHALVSDLASTQIALNRLIASIMHNLDLTGNPPFLEGQSADVARTALPNRPGVRLPVRDVAQVKWMDVPQLHPIIPPLIQFFITELERISGLSAINRGFTPTGRNSTEVLDSVQESGFVRIRSHLRSLEWALRGAYEKLACLVVENYTTPRLVAITGPQGERTSLALMARHFHVPTAAGASPLRFTILVSAGSALPTSQQAKEARAVQLYAMGAIDRTALLEVFDYPNREAIVKRITELEALGAFNPPGARQRARRG